MADAIERMAPAHRACPGEALPLGRLPWRQKALGVLRIVFGIAWAIDAQFKWQPSFQNGFAGYLTSALDGQPSPVKSWIGFWINIVSVNPHVFAVIVAWSETALAISLIFGICVNLSTICGVLFTFVIWSVPEGFGGPYKAGATDIGTAIIYLFVFVALFLSQAGMRFGVDRRLTPWLGRWGWLASGPVAPAPGI
jgi:uncharacterized membrane protein YphA (DoxX/SURF4 family)